MTTKKVYGTKRCGAVDADHRLCELAHLHLGSHLAEKIPGLSPPLGGHVAWDTKTHAGPAWCRMCDQRASVLTLNRESLCEECSSPENVSVFPKFEPFPTTVPPSASGPSFMFNANGVEVLRLNADGTMFHMGKPIDGSSPLCFALRDWLEKSQQVAVSPDTAELARLREDRRVARLEVERLKVEVECWRVSSSDESNRAARMADDAQWKVTAAVYRAQIAENERDAFARDLVRLQREASKLRAEIEKRAKRRAGW